MLWFLHDSSSFFPSFLSFSPTLWPSVMPSLPCSMTGLDTTQRPIISWTSVNLLQGWYHVWSSLYQVASSLDPSSPKSSPVLLLCACAKPSLSLWGGDGGARGRSLEQTKQSALSVSIVWCLLYWCLLSLCIIIHDALLWQNQPPFWCTTLWDHTPRSRPHYWTFSAGYILYTLDVYIRA